MADDGTATAAGDGSRPLCSLHVADRSTVPVVGGVVAESADVLGLGAGDRSRLRAVVQEVVESIIEDSFADGQPVDLDVTVERRPGGMAVVIEDRGAPSSMARGAYPPRIADLVRLGFADDFSAHNEGMRGNRTELLKDLSYASIGDDESLTNADADAEVTIEVGPDGEPAVEVREMVPGDALEVARLFFRCYGYSAYYAPAVYEPDRLAELVQAGRHLATVAVTPSGRVVGHLSSEVERPGATTGKIGLLAVEPAYRRMHLSGRLGLVHVQRLLALGFVGQFTEAVTVHTRSQEIALKTGAHEAGVLLAAQQNTLEFHGFDQDHAQRPSAIVFYGAFGSTPARTVHVPKAYADVLTRIYTDGNLPRTVVTSSRRQDDEVPAQSRFHVNLRHQAGVAVLKVEEYGRDFDEALQQQLEELRLNRYEVVWLFLPLSDPRTGYFGDGLQEMGLSFAGVYPEYDDGDVLVLQGLNYVEVDPSSIAVVSPLGEYVRDFVLEDRRKAMDSSARLVRSRARMARYFEALA